MKKYLLYLLIIIIFIFSFSGCSDTSVQTDVTETAESGESVIFSESPVSVATEDIKTTLNEMPSATENVVTYSHEVTTSSPDVDVAPTATATATATAKVTATAVSATTSVIAAVTTTVASVTTSAPSAIQSSSFAPTAKPTASSTAKPTVKPTATPVKTDEIKSETDVLPSNPDESQIIEYLGLENVGRDIDNDAFDKIAQKTGGKTLYVKDYGAKGDGITNDKSAIDKAINALSSAPAGSTLVFESNKTYYCGSKSEALKLSSLSYKIIQGNNTTILIDAPAKYIDMIGCRNFAIKGLNFNYKTKPYAFSKSVSDIDTSAYTATITMDRSLGITGTYTAPSVEFFAVVNRDDGRYHMSISKIDVVDESEYKYKITFNNTFGSIASRLNLIKANGIIVPMPSVGHSVEQAFTILNNTNIALKDCNVYSACKFMFFLRGNTDKVVFENFNVTPDPAEYNGDIRIVGWRDGFHCKENRAQLIWKDCTLKWVYDDMFNISCTMTKISDIEETASGTAFTLYCPETASTYNYMKAGDRISIYNSSTGKLVGVSTIKRVRSGKIYLNDEISGLKNGLYVAVDSLAAPDSQIINCDIRGTMRFRTPMYIVDSDIHCTRMWLAFELAGGRYLEGPVAENILFSNCKFTFDDTSLQYIEIFSSNTASANALKRDNSLQD